MRYRYFTCEVFTETRFGGNQLAVLPEAQGLGDEQMQQIAREFNYSECAFVFPQQAGHTCKVRIFTPETDVPFAGHRVSEPHLSLKPSVRSTRETL